MASSEGHPKFNNPPVIEVYFRQYFETLAGLKTPHIGIFWDIVKSNFPSFEAKPYLPPQIETFENPPQNQKPRVLQIPAMQRTWFLSETENEILQIQPDQLITNWRKISPEDRYPHYDEIVEKYFQYSNLFESFISDRELGEIKNNQLELTYINHITSSNGWTPDAPLEEIFPSFRASSSQNNFLPKIDSVNWTNTYVLPNQEGRLYATIRTVWHKKYSNEPIIQFQLLVRGIGEDCSPEGIRSWFDQAHDWIVLSFGELTSEQVQCRNWEKQDGS